VNELATHEVQCYAYTQQIRWLLDRINRLMERNEQLAKENEQLRATIADLQDSNAMLTAAASEHAATLRESWRRGKLLTENNIDINQLNQQENETK
jgi:regulator of replication initiation timing